MLFDFLFSIWTLLVLLNGSSLRNAKPFNELLLEWVICSELLQRNLHSNTKFHLDFLALCTSLRIQIYYLSFSWFSWI